MKQTAFLILTFFNCWCKVSFAQITLVTTHDTVVCQNQPIQLHAIVNNSPTTSISYSIVSVPYNPDPFTSSTVFHLADDDQTQPIALPFSFCFWGNTYNQFIISSNGWISFGKNQPNTWFGATIPNNSGAVPTDCIMAAWHDLDPSIGGTIGYSIYGKAPFRRVVINYNNVPLFQNNCGVTYTGQIKLYETTNVIETQIQNKFVCNSWNGGAATHGLHNTNGTTAIIVNGRNYTSWATNNEGYKFIPSGVATDIINWYCNGNLIGNGNTISVTPQQNSTYTAIAYFGCGSIAKDTSVVHITVSNIQFDHSSLITSPISCAGKNDGALQANASGGFGKLNYSWNTTPIQTTHSITGLNTGNYTVKVTDSIGCSVQKTAALIAPQILNVQAKNISFPTCSYSKDGAISLSISGGTQPYQYVWSNGNTNSTAQQLANGTYSVMITDAHQCSDSLSTQIFTPAFSVNAGPDRTIGGSESTILRADMSIAGFYNFQWSPSYQLSTTSNATVTANPHHTTVYKVIATNANGCSVTDSVTVKVKFDNNIVLINAFSPNNDGQNDDFSLRKYGDIFHLKTISIYNRWGQKVYESADINQGWDGTFNNKPQDVGSYLFSAAITDFEGEEHLLKGSINLIR